ncbi:MAG TPA: FAD-dependent oxidoreductase [Actinomycetota bacterium]
MTRLVVVGGGVAGLAAARAGARAGWRVTLLEASQRLGGKVLTEEVDGVPWEWGPDAIAATKPRGEDLLEELGLLEDALPPATGRAYLLVGGELRPIPPGLTMGFPKGPGALMEAARSGIVTRAEALRGAMEGAMPGRPRGSIAEVARARLGRGVAEKLTLPLVSAVFGTADQDLEAAIPEMAGARSVTAGAARRPPVRFLGLRGGMGRLAEALVEKGVEVRTGARAEAIEGSAGAYVVRADGAGVEADAVVVAVPAPSARPLLPSLPEGLGAYTSSAVIHLRYPEGALGRPLDAAGYVAADPGVVQACSWVSSKWPHLEEPGPHLRAVVVEPAIDDDEALALAVVEEVGRVMEAGADPDVVRVRPWALALPRYLPGHVETVRRIREALPPSIQLAGASFDGVGVPDCVASGEEAFRRIAALWETTPDAG